MVFTCDLYNLVQITISGAFYSLYNRRDWEAHDLISTSELPNTKRQHKSTSFEASDTYLAPDEHAAEDDLESIEEVVPHEDDRGAPGRPALARTDRLDRRRRCGQKPWARSNTAQWRHT